MCHILNWEMSQQCVPTRTGKPGKMGNFPVREKSGLNRLEKSGKSQGKSHKNWKTQGISDKYYFLFFGGI